VVWLADAVYMPERLAGRPFVQIADKGTAQLLGLPWRVPHLYTLEELIPALQRQSALVLQLAKAEEDAARGLGGAKVTGQEAELLAVFRRVQEVVTLGRTFSLTFPVFVVRDEGLAKRLGMTPGAPFDYMTMMELRPRYVPLLDGMTGRTAKALTNADKDLLGMALRAKLMADDRESALFRVMPPLWAEAKGEWVSPWQSYVSGLGGPAHLAQLQVWKQAMEAWQNADPDAFAKATQALAQPPIKARGIAWPPAWKLELERMLNALKPFSLAMNMSLLGALLVAGAMWLGRWRGLVLALASGFAGTAVVAVAAGLVARVVILGRPPVATLYESVLFVSFSAGVVGLALALRRRDAGLLGVVCTAMAVLLGVAHVLAGQGDTLGMLIAVLNTNFWLTTHVLTITGGYGLCLVLAVAAHGLLAQQAWAAWHGKPVHRNIKAEHGMVILAVLALLFTAVGTVLGGVWADQSWGRFWGWDPKENGALLIVLWLVLLLHVRLGRLVELPLFLAGCAATTLVVAVSWFGVNLLSVGLHSYGFTQGMAGGLAVFACVQTALILTLWGMATLKRRGR
jgi:ABC-type transport system involved in cytochrome c biogenesis permease subunit